MRYMFLLYGNEADDLAPDDPGFEAMMAGYAAFGQEARAKGAFVVGERLQPVATATTLRTSEGKPVLIDGPFAETREQLGGFYLECEDRDEAAAYAAKIPAATHGSVEVRPLVGHDQRVLDEGDGPKYMLLIYGDESKFLPPESEAVRRIIDGHQQFTSRAIDEGAFVAADALALSSSAVTVRVRDGQVVQTDGPFAETREQVGGFYVLRCRDLDEALDYARDLREATNPGTGPEHGCIDVRPIWET